MGEGAGHQPCNDDALDLDKRVPWEKEGRKRGRVWKGGSGEGVEGRKRGRVVEGRKRREGCGRGGGLWEEEGEVGRKRGEGCGRGERVVEEGKVVGKKSVYVNRWAVENQEIMVLSFLT